MKCTWAAENHRRLFFACGTMPSGQLADSSPPRSQEKFKRNRVRCANSSCARLQQAPNGGSGEKSGPTIKGVTVTPPPNLFGARQRNAASWPASSVPRSTPHPV